MKHEIAYYTNGNKRFEYDLNDSNLIHNESGPAVIWYYESGNKFSEEYNINELYHNTKGPAYIKYDENGNILCKEYWLNGKKIVVNSDEEFQKYIKRLNIS